MLSVGRGGCVVHPLLPRDQRNRCAVDLDPCESPIALGSPADDKPALTIGRPCDVLDADRAIERHPLGHPASCRDDANRGNRIAWRGESDRGSISREIPRQKYFGFDAGNLSATTSNRVKLREDSIPMIHLAQYAWRP